ncbi:hypothetical protein LVJ94_39720 [Pendulispora rubella]|uniref:Transglycosylase SLT domain-containing protein n=1 Tax=Pendulispora rubella TaxID=2741070 RepID=A0ABZ2KWF2_9BACT
MNKTIRRTASRVTVPAFCLLATSLFLAPAASAGTRGPNSAVAPDPRAVECTQQSTLDGTHLSDVQIAQYARNAGLHGDGLVISIAVALAESQGWTRAVLINTDCSRDRGVWQINSYWHSEVSDDQAFDPAGCAAAAYNISSGGTNWTPWTTYNNGAYQQYMSRARDAANQVGG